MARNMALRTGERGMVVVSPDVEESVADGEGRERAVGSAGMGEAERVV